MVVIKAMEVDEKEEAATADTSEVDNLAEVGSVKET